MDTCGTPMLLVARGVMLMLLLRPMQLLMPMLMLMLFSITEPTATSRLTYGHLRYPYVIGRKRRDADAAPEADAAPDADADALLYYRTYGYYPSYYYGHLRYPHLVGR